MIIQSNSMSLRAYNANRKTTSSIKKNLEKLSSGYRINCAADDAAGLGVSERLLAKVTELDRANQNASEGINLAQTADAALQEVNDMLKRARSLCIQAANGTYSDQELATISNEMNQLFDEIDRISASSYYNSICLFRGEVEEVPPEYHYEYVEVFKQIDGVQKCGEVDFIQDSQFQEADDAIPATATFTLSDEIKFDDPTTLEGKSIKIGTQTFYFTSSSSSPTATTAITVCHIGAGTDAVEEALKSLTVSSHVVSVAVDKDARTVTLTAALSDLTEPVQADGKTLNFTAVDGQAADKNGINVSSPNLQQVDGSGATNNQPEYGTTLTGTFALGIESIADKAQLDNLNRNTVGFGSADTTIHLSDLNLQVGDTKDTIGNAIANALNQKNSNYQVKYSDGTFTVMVSNQPADSPTYTYFQEGTVSGTGGGYVYGTSWTSKALGINVLTTQSTAEAPEESRITIPQNPTVPFSFYMNGSYYLYFDSSNPSTPLTVGEYNLTDYSTSTPTRIDTRDMSAADIQADIVNKVRSHVSRYGNVSVNGNVITVTANSVGTSMNLSSYIRGTAITVTPCKYNPSSGGSTRGLDLANKTEGISVSSSSGALRQDITVLFSLDTDISSLAGKGFTIGSKSYSSNTIYSFEFVNGGTGLSTSYNDIDISGCSDFDELAGRVQTALRNRLGSTYQVSIDSNGEMTISIARSSTTSEYTLPVVIDGDDGITDGTPVQFEGGVNTGHSQATIDFSSIHEDNLDTLLGKGFRINCATCSGEYINVFFCWTNDGSVPDSFEKEDPDTGEIRTIHNVAVELSKVTSGDKIVESIVNQVRPSLNHYTDLMVGDPTTTLIAMEKRVGDVMYNGELKLGSVKTGVETNFTYSVTVEQVLTLPSTSETTLKSTNVNIYVGSDPEAQWIPIHLPYIDLTTLCLAPPEQVDLTDASQSASDWLDRVDYADLAISNARGTIGADYNRLEHAIQDLSNAHIQLSDAYSVIRDADVAELMMKQVKDQILLQAQQAMLSQANQVPQGVLQLIQ